MSEKSPSSPSESGRTPSRGLADFEAFYLARFREPERCSVTAAATHERCPGVAKYAVTSDGPVRLQTVYVCDLCLGAAVRAASKRRPCTVERLTTPASTPSANAASQSDGAK